MSDSLTIIQTAIEEQFGEQLSQLGVTVKSGPLQAPKDSSIVVPSGVNGLIFYADPSAALGDGVAITAIRKIMDDSFPNTPYIARSQTMKTIGGGAVWKTPAVA